MRMQVQSIVQEDAFSKVLYLMIQVQGTIQKDGSTEYRRMQIQTASAAVGD